MSGPGRRFFIVDEDQLHDKILELSPELQRDTERMADLIREMVKFEREKLGLDNPRGALELCRNQQKFKASDPDLIGGGRIAGRSYRAAGWLWGKEKIRIALLPKAK
jgi:hypothetical protein